MKSLTIEILDEKVLSLLQELELKNLIRLISGHPKKEVNWSKEYKGGMTRQPIAELDAQLKTLRSEWE
jgi:hypothetical protein